jgi:hypothetical protein
MARASGKAREVGSFHVRAWRQRLGSLPSDKQGRDASEGTLITRDFADRFAEEWIAAWNAHDLPRVLSHYDDDFEMASPLIVAIAGEPSGVLRGKKSWRILGEGPRAIARRASPVASACVGALGAHCSAQGCLGAGRHYPGINRLAATITARRMSLVLL